MDNPLQYFAELKDPRVERNRDHLLEEILLMAIASVLSGAESWNDMEEYGKAKQDWLKSFLQLPGVFRLTTRSIESLRPWTRKNWRRALWPGSARLRG